MKKIILAGVVLALVGCASPNYETRTSVSNFDGTVAKRSTPALLTCNEWKEECPVLTFISSSKDDETIGIGLEVNSPINYYNFRSLAFNIDGKIIAADNVGLTDHRYNQYIKSRESKAVFILPKSMIAEMKSANRIWVKVSTLQNGAFERAMFDNGVESKAYKALKAFNP